MKILFFINGIYLGGKERRLVQLMKELKLKNEFQFELVVMNSEINYPEIFDLNIPIHYLIRKTKKDFSVFWRFFKIAKNFKPHIIHCWDTMTATYSIPSCFLLNANMINGMVVDSPIKEKIFNKKLFRAKLLFPFSDLIIGNSYAGLKAYGSPERKSMVIYNGYNFNRNKNLKEVTEVREEFDITTKYVIGMIASFSEFKDYKTYYEAADIVLQKRKDVTFLAIGNKTDSAESKELINPKNIQSFRLLGKKLNIESIINACDICVLATFTEGISNSILEYMALQKPVIATSGGGTKEIVEENQTGFLVKVSDAKELAGKMELLLNDSNLREKMGEKGQEKVRDVFSIQQMIDKYVSVYRNLILKKNQPSYSEIANRNYLNSSDN